LGIGGFIGWEKYQAYQEEKQERAKAAVEEAARLACVSRLERIPVPKDAVASEIPTDIQVACDADSSATLYNYHPVLPLPPGATLISPKPKPKFTIESPPQPPPQPQPDCEVIACADWAVVGTDVIFGGTQIRPRCYFDENRDISCTFAAIAKLRKGDRVQILSDKIRSSDGVEIYEIKFQQWTGWVGARALAPEKGNDK
jgi:hypothetical protein